VTCNYREVQATEFRTRLSQNFWVSLSGFGSAQYGACQAPRSNSHLSQGRTEMVWRHLST